MELACHTRKGAMNHTDHLAGLGIGVVLCHDVGIAEIRVAQGTKLNHLPIGHFTPLGGIVLTKSIAGDRAFNEQLYKIALAVVLLQKNEVVNHRGQHATKIAFAVGLFDVHHGNEVVLAFLGEKLADFQFLAIE